ncbi:O-antigen ligase family protein [Pontibacter sp. E15-1]|uniref:O-antigen ligase family protein n=1 Tax=Pontibacter sp. E15-1 TaxID=2919918 RepID=UPI001F4FA42C|nr:O-antigen ligase family protein [Pontibacter sp. E15-1]MCJ8166398.1 O-antigen ligase family protein [Pontibacter sp. E15-1]
MNLLSSYRNKTPFILVCLLGITIPQPLHLERAVVVLMFISGIVVLYNRRKQPDIRGSLYLPALLPPLFLIMHAIGLLYSDDLSRGWHNIETKLALLVVPLYVSMVWKNGLDRKETDKILLFFVLSCCAAYLYLIFKALLLLISVQAPEVSVAFAFSRDNLASYLFQHPVYIALIAACCFQVLVYFLMQYWTGMTLIRKLVLILALMISFGVVILMGARMSLIAVTVTVVAWLSILILNRRKYFLGLVLLLFFSVSVISAILYIPNIRARFKEIADTEFVPPKGAYHNSTNLRVGQLYCSLKVIEDNYIWGTGTGDYQTSLNKCYKAHNFSDVLYLLSYNPHNQYLQSFLTLGIIGILLLSGALLVPLVLAIREKDWVVFMLFLVLMMSMTTESVLQTNLGVMLFAFIYGLFILRSKLYDKTSHR